MLKPALARFGIGSHYAYNLHPEAGGGMTQQKYASLVLGSQGNNTRDPTPSPFGEIGLGSEHPPGGSVSSGD